jgi:branched-subunit amino acid aminotransferase/4-amino-4-deoxychorismate lyase
MKTPVPEGEVWWNGKFVPAGEASVGLEDPGFQFGLGVFETLAVRDGSPLELDEHLRRLRQSANALGVGLPVEGELVRAAIRIGSAVPGGFGWLKILATRGGACFVYGGRMDPAEEGKPVAAILLHWKRGPKDPSVGVKSLSYADRILGLEIAAARGAEEGLWRNIRGHLTEGCQSNLFVVQRAKLFTPALGEGILPGVVRGLAIEAARRVGLVVHETRVRVERLERANEAFLTSSLRGVRPLVRFEGKPIGDGKPGAWTLAIAEEVRRIRRPSFVRAEGA